MKLADYTLCELRRCLGSASHSALVSPKRSNLGPTGYTPSGTSALRSLGAMHPAWLCQATAEQSARGSLVRAQTRSRLIM
jgi:hypothetical protein